MIVCDRDVILDGEDGSVGGIYGDEKLRQVAYVRHDRVVTNQGCTPNN